MSKFRFWAEVRGHLTYEKADAFYGAGCSDMTFSEQDGVIRADVVREAPDLLTAMTTAGRAIQSVLGSLSHISCVEMEH